MKNPDQQAIEHATAEFLARGGVITVCAPEDRAPQPERRRTRRERIARRKELDWAQKNAHRARKSRGH